METTSAGIFLSYRREDTPYLAGWLADRLCSRFGDGAVFRDVASIPYGTDFAEAISEALAGCQVLLVVIGPKWLDDQNNRRIRDAEDYVRLEIEAGLKGGVRVIPVLVDGAKMPRSQDLPGSLAKLTTRRAVELSYGDFDQGVELLLGHLEKVIQSSPGGNDPPTIPGPIHPKPPHGASRPRKGGLPKPNQRTPRIWKRVVLPILGVLAVSGVVLLLVLPRVAPHSPTNDFIARYWWGATATVTGERYNVRQLPNGNIVGEARRGKTVAISCTEGDWSRLAIPWPGSYIHTPALRMESGVPRC